MEKIIDINEVAEKGSCFGEENVGFGCVVVEISGIYKWDPLEDTYETPRPGVG